MERGAGRSPEERRAAAEARARARDERPEEPQEPREPVDEDRIDEELVRRSPEGKPMTRHYGAADIYGRRRLFAAAGIVALIFVLFLMLGGC
jgi:hypothetical protein